MKQARKITGYLLLIMSCIAFAALPVIPFLQDEPERLAVWAGAVFVFAEVTWWLAILLLGREIIDWGKKLLQKLLEEWRRDDQGGV